MEDCMSYEMLESPIELTDADLDAVATGGTAQKGLVNVAALNETNLALNAAVGVLSAVVARQEGRQNQ
jgi:hypothetical protein